MHMLTLEKTTVADAGLYTARTNYDFTECNVGIRGRKLLNLNIKKNFIRIPLLVRKAPSKTNNSE